MAKHLDPYEQFIISREEAGDDPREIRRKLRQCATHRCGCGKPATKLCDREIARCGETAEALICSRPICSGCAVWAGTKFFSGPAGGIDTEDFCPGHAVRSKVSLVSAWDIRRLEKLGRGIVFRAGSPVCAEVD